LGCAAECRNEPAINMASDLSPPPELSEALPDERWALLQRIAASSVFQKSNRLREFLLYVGEASLRHPDHVIREQEIGIAVFGRAANYDTSQDTLVRVQASQLRKKLQQYFLDEGKDEPLILEMPKGSYVPVFHRRVTELEPVHLEAVPIHRSAPQGWPNRLLTALLVLSLAATGLLLIQNTRLSHRAELGLGQQPEVDQFWRQMFGNGHPTYMAVADGNLLILQDQIQRMISLSEYQGKAFERMAEKIEDPKLRALTVNAVNRQYTNMADVQLARRMGLICASNELPLDIVLARDMTAAQIAQHNTILLGSRRANPWVSLFEESLNFQTVFEETPKVVYFNNKAPRQGEKEQYRGVWSKMSYCRVAFLPNQKGTGSVLLISGTDVQSTEAGGDLMTNEVWVHRLRERLAVAPDQPMPYFEALLEGKQYNNTVPTFEIVAWRKH
jgi:hypothetical protein